MIFQVKYNGYIMPVINNLDYILKKVCEASGFNEDILKTKCRKREHTEARQAYFLIAMNLTNKSLVKIGASVSRNHATVLHAKKNAHLPEIKQIIAKTNLL